MVGLVVVAGLVASLLAWRHLTRLPAVSTRSGPGTTYLILGSDSRAGASEELKGKLGGKEGAELDRADVIVVVRVDADGASRSLSIPRDLVVVDDEEFPQRLGMTLLDGPDALARALCRSLDLGIDRAVMVRAGALVGVVDALGGLPLELEQAVRDEPAHLDLAAGAHRLDGLTALALARSRQPQLLRDGEWEPLGDDEGAVWRSTWSSTILSTAAAEFARANPLAKAGAASAGLRGVAVDEDMTVGEIVRLADAARSSSEVLPTEALDERARVPAEGAAGLVDDLGMSGCRLP